MRCTHGTKTKRLNKTWLKSHEMPTFLTEYLMVCFQSVSGILGDCGTVLVAAAVVLVAAGVVLVAAAVVLAAAGVALVFVLL